MKGVSFRFRPHLETGSQPAADVGASAGRQLGFIAQEVAEVLPELVQTNIHDGSLGVNYIAVIPLLVEALKEQQAQIEELKSQLKNDR